MKKLLVPFFQKSNFVQLHIAAVALATTGIFMAVTASDLGVLAPLVISQGIYALIFALSLEVYLGIYILVVVSARKFLKNELSMASEFPFESAPITTTK